MHDSKIIQESNLTARQPRRAPHHVIQATTSEELAHSKVPTWTLLCCYRVGFEPATLGAQGTELTTEPPRVAQDLWYHRRDFYLMYTDLSISEKSPLWKVFSSDISGHSIECSISWRPMTPHPKI